MKKTTIKSWRQFGLGALAVAAATLTDYGLANVGFVGDQLQGILGAIAVPAYVGLLEWVRNYLKYGQ